MRRWKNGSASNLRLFPGEERRDLCPFGKPSAEEMPSRISLPEAELRVVPHSDSPTTGGALENHTMPRLHEALDRTANIDSQARREAFYSLSSQSPLLLPSRIMATACGLLRRSRAAAGCLALCMMLVGAQGGDYVLLVDVSSSMNGSVGSGDPRVRIAVVKNSLSAFIRELPPESRVYLAAFNKEMGAPTEAVIRSDDNRRMLLDVVERLDGLTRKPEAGATHLWWALDHALAKGVEYSKDRPDRTVLVRVLTDGEDNDPSFKRRTAQSVLDEYATKYPGVDGRSIPVKLTDKN